MEIVSPVTGLIVGRLSGNLIYDASGKLRARIEGSRVFTTDGIPIGEYEDGLFQDRSGDTVAFTRGDAAHPGVPVPSLIPVALPVGMCPMGGGLAGAGLLRIWSRYTWDQFLSGRK
jgi:hypothetical protein